MLVVVEKRSKDVEGGRLHTLGLLASGKYKLVLSCLLHIEYRVVPVELGASSIPSPTSSIDLFCPWGESVSGSFDEVSARSAAEDVVAAGCSTAPPSSFPWSAASSCKRTASSPGRFGAGSASIAHSGALSKSRKASACVTSSAASNVSLPCSSRLASSSGCSSKPRLTSASRSWKL